ncbi:tetratricopeptide repeat protein [Pontibacter arcticus]|uniref:Molecular chaperone DnaJ n=1 Tax=Pontibacter arcticus TaxID=2080288 RepID=A0A364RIZ2_9BACT|nr:DnaJ domain-containing protein [Pontibacter arcticus]RAU84196.1 molecular chaperone DnaJ [Pontibacter arcticus]
MSQTYYTILSISPTATAQEVKTAYKQLALKYHPDRNPGNVWAEEQFKQINAAYQVLSNPGKRARYDMQLQYELAQRRLASQPTYYNPRYQQTREPAPVSERYYRNIQRENQKFSVRDWLITLAFIAGVILFSLAFKYVMDHIAGEDNYKTALTYLKHGKYTSAHSMFSETIHFIPDHAAAYQQRASIELDFYEDYDAAISDLNQAISLTTKEPIAKLYFMRGYSYKQLGKYDAAETDLNRAIELDSLQNEAYLRRGEVRLFYKQQYKAATADFTTFLKRPQSTKATVEALTYRGFGHYKQQNYTSAENDYRMGLALEKENGRLYYLLGRAEMAQQMPDSACQHLYKAYNLGYSAAILQIRDNCR